MAKTVAKNLAFILIGGTLYYWIELLFRGFSHPTMFFLGGLCFWGIGLLCRGGGNEWPLWLQALVGGFLVTGAELVSGCILNLWLGMNIWDYSYYWGNLWGQICPQFSLLWVALAATAAGVNALLCRHMWGEGRGRKAEIIPANCNETEGDKMI